MFILGARDWLVRIVSPVVRSVVTFMVEFWW